MARLDPHSYADAAQAVTVRFEVDLSVDFAAKVLTGRVELKLREPAKAGPLDLDTRGLTIDAVLDHECKRLAFKIHEPDAVLGNRLEVEMREGTRSIRIAYRTAPDASALQWLTPEQTAGGKEPYLFSQCQAIHARSVVPCQDTPSIRQTFKAGLEVPAHLRGVMAAAPVSRTELKNGRAIENFEMPQPIPPYLFAFAVGDLKSKDLSPRSRVWAEPGQVEAAAQEFSGVEAMMKAAEQLFGPYDWERFDLLVMPPSFPYGGMENPRLTFLTPALLTGDKSQVNVVAHELAHSWTGNLVTNTNAEHFWLNEGFTVFAERRILEALEGAELAGLHAALGLEELQKAIAQFSAHPELTKLHTHLEGVDPDEAFSLVPYEKGYLFLKALEAAAGRARFDALLATWLRTHRFGAATTQDFTTLVEELEPGLLAKVNAPAWLDAPGLPATYPVQKSARLEAVRRTAGRVPTREETKAWSPTEWQLYLEATPRPASLELCRSLESAFALTTSKNPEVLVAWLTLACEAGDASVLPRTEELLGRFGRMKYLKPLYRSLVARAETKPLARTLFDRLRPRYHPIAQQVIAGVLKAAGV